MALLSRVMREAALTGRTDTVDKRIWGRQGGRWAEQTARAAFPRARPAQPAPPAQADPAEALRALTDLRRRGVVTDEEFEILRARLGIR